MQQQQRGGALSSSTQLEWDRANWSVKNKKKKRGKKKSKQNKRSWSVLSIYFLCFVAWTLHTIGSVFGYEGNKAMGHAYGCEGNKASFPISTRLPWWGTEDGPAAPRLQQTPPHPPHERKQGYAAIRVSRHAPGGQAHLLEHLEETRTVTTKWESRSMLQLIQHEN